MKYYALHPELIPEEIKDQFRKLWKIAQKSNALVQITADEVNPQPAKKKHKGTTSIYSQAFEDFWQTLPHKIGKGAAYKAWQKAIKDGATQEKINEGVKGLLVYVKKQKASMKDGYTPLHPSTWLNEKRFDDEIGTDFSKPKLNATDAAAIRIQIALNERVGAIDKNALGDALAAGWSVNEILAQQHRRNEGMALSHFFWTIAETTK